MKSRYIVMKASEQTSENGEFFPDVLSYPNKKFSIRNPLNKGVISQRYKQRFYLACYDVYGVCSYDDYVLWLNGISSVHSLVIGETFLMPEKSDIENFIIENEVYS